MTDAERLERTKFAVFFERQELDRQRVLSWNLCHYGFETEEDARACHDILLKATNHESRMPRGFRNVRLCKKASQHVWQDMR
jgi:hypothetical protein